MDRALIKKSAVRASTFSIFIDNYLLMTRTRDAAAKSPLSKKHQLNKIGSSCFETLETGWPADRKNIPFLCFLSSPLSSLSERNSTPTWFFSQEGCLFIFSGLKCRKNVLEKAFLHKFTYLDCH